MTLEQRGRYEPDIPSASHKQPRLSHIQSSPPSSLFDFTVSAIMCWCPFSIKCDLQLGGDILGWVISRELYSVLPYSNINAQFFA